MGSVVLIFACAARGRMAAANPLLVMSVPARWEQGSYVADPNGRREPICEACARQLLARFQREGLPIPAVVQQPDYFALAYHAGADEEEV
jgi:hypothetical protein